jgi:hypothetical protein
MGKGWRDEIIARKFKLNINKKKLKNIINEVQIY